MSITGHTLFGHRLHGQVFSFVYIFNRGLLGVESIYVFIGALWQTSYRGNRITENFRRFVLLNLRLRLAIIELQNNNQGIPQVVRLPVEYPTRVLDESGSSGSISSQEGGESEQEEFEPDSEESSDDSEDTLDW